MSEQKVVKRATCIRATGSPFPLVDGTYAEAYYLGEAWVEKLSELFGPGTKSISQILYDLAIVKEEASALYSLINLKPGIEERILNDLKAADGRAVLYKDICKGLPSILWPLVKEVLEKLVAEGRVEKTRNSRYRLHLAGE